MQLSSKYLFRTESHMCLQGLGTDEDTLIEIICSRTNQELCEINRVYRESKFTLKVSVYYVFTLSYLDKLPSVWIWLLVSYTSALILWQLDIRYYLLLVSWIFVCVYIVSSCCLVANKLEKIYYSYKLCLNAGGL